MSLFAATTSGKNAKAPSVQKEDQENYAQTKAFSDPKVNDQSGSSSLGKTHAAVQAKLNIGSPGDKFEKEADDTANRVMSKSMVQKSEKDDSGKMQAKFKGVQPEKEEKIQEKTEGSEINMESFWEQFHASEQPVEPKPVQLPPSKLSGRSLFSAGGEKKPGAGGAAKAAKGKGKEEKIQKKEEESPEVSAQEEPINKKAFLQTLPEESVQEKEEEKISKKAFLQTATEDESQEVQTELFDENKEVRNDMLNAKEDESSVALAKEEDVQPKEDDGELNKKSLLQAKEEDVMQAAEEEAPEMQTELFDENKEVRNGKLNAKEEDLQAKSDVSREAGSAFESTLKSTKGSGNSLNDSLQSEMSDRFGGKDFSGVKIHTDSNAVDMNKEINSKAFTNKNDIYFNQGQFDANSTKGKTLLAHELTHTVQQGAVPEESVQREMSDEFVHNEDGENVKKRMHEDAEDESGEEIDFEKTASEEEKEEARNDVDHEEKAEQTGKISGKGIAKPDVDRPAEELPKVEKAASEGKANMEKKPEQKGGDKEQQPQPRVDMAETDMREVSALEAYQNADKTKMPAVPKPFKEPVIQEAVDQTGEPVPGDPQMDKTVMMLHNIAKQLAENAYTLQSEAANDTRESFNMKAVLEEGHSKTASARAGSLLAKQDKMAREEVNTQVEGSYEKNVENVELVKKEAPGMIDKAAGGKVKAGPMVDEAKAKKQEMKDEETEESGQDEKDQQEDTNKVADGSMEMDSALAGAGEGSQKYLDEALAGEKKNEAARTNLDENKKIAESTGTEIDRIDKETAVSEEQLMAMDYYPEMVQEQTAKRAQSGAELYAAAVVMNDQLIDIQDEYYSLMKSEVPGKEEATKKLAEMQKEQEAAEKENPPEEQNLSEEEMMLFDMANMEQPELDAHLMSMDEDQLTKLQDTLSGMETQEEQKPEEPPKDLAGRTGDYDLMAALTGKKEEEGPEDPRAMWYGEIEQNRGARVGEVKQIADVNFVYLSKEQKAMLAQKMAMSDAVTGLFDINITEMGKSMILGMIDPRESLKGVLSGANQMIGGVVNLFNAEAWEKDPLGNLLQSAASIATGLTTIFMSITGLAIAINILMGALTIASLGTMSWLTGPVIGFMTSVISTVGGWTVITGLIALELNALTYIKNLHDAGNAENTDELLFESDSMKKNLTDGFTSLTAVVGGKGSVKGANTMKSKILKAGGMDNFLKLKVSKFKGGVKSGFNKFKNFAAKTGKNVKNFTVQSIAKVKNGIKNAIAKVKGMFKKDPPGTFRDKNGRLRDKKTGQFVKDPNKKVPVNKQNLIGQNQGGRRTPRQSELDALERNPGFEDQVSFKDGVEVPHGKKGSTRPDGYNPGPPPTALEVKNYGITTPKGRSSLFNNIKKQFQKRVKEMPEGTRHKYVIDVRGQAYTKEMLQILQDNIKKITNQDVQVSFIL